MWKALTGTFGLACTAVGALRTASATTWLMPLAAGLALTVSAGCVARSGDMSTSGQREPFVRSLPETGEYTRLLAKDEGVSMRSGLVTLAPGENCGEHSTDDFEELIICLAGAGEVETEGLGRRSLAAGQYAYNPPHTQHNVFNTGRKPMRYIYVVAPARFD